MQGPFPPAPFMDLEPLLPMQLPSPSLQPTIQGAQSPGIEGLGPLGGRELPLLFHSPRIQRVLFCPLPKPWGQDNLVPGLAPSTLTFLRFFTHSILGSVLS